jgi:DNA recombination protein Rad52
MTGFSEQQQKLLSAKLDGRYVRARNKNGTTLHYIEGWHAIAEANRVFGFAGWDRETIAVDVLGQSTTGGTVTCSYRARVRIRVRAGDTIIYRDGVGVGHGQGPSAGDAHELAVKDAETDATKRALATFGNIFGLALYDRARAWVKNKHLIEGLQERQWFVRNGAGEVVASCPDAPAFCAALRRTVQATKTAPDAEAIWKANHASLMQLAENSELRTPSGVHYADVLERVYTSHVAQLRITAANGADVKESECRGEALETTRTRRLRDEDHLRLVAKQPCLICGRLPSHAHHLRFVQPRALGKKVSDEWTVPLCVLHHRALHDVGDEEKWWEQNRIRPVAEAERLWRRSHPDLLAQGPESANADAAIVQSTA